MSLRVLIIAVLTLLGVLAASVVVFESLSMRKSFTGAQEKTLSRVIKISSDEILRQTNDLLAEVASGAQKDKGFKKAAKKLTKNPNSIEHKELVTEFLNEQFHQKMVTAGIISLKKIRIYDLKFNMVAESSEGIKGLKQSLPQSILETAKPRKKAERLKIVNAIWMSHEGVLTSLLAPVGGLILSGYIEVVADPVHNLRSLENMMGSPISLIGIDDEVKFQSENWTQVESDTTLAINYDLLDENNRPALHIQMLENLQGMYSDIQQTELLVASVFLAVFGGGVLLSILTLNKFIFTPMKKMVENLSYLAKGDMGVTISRSDNILEIKRINNGLSEVVENLGQKLSEISDIGNLLKESSLELSSQAQRSVSSANQQNNDISLLLAATERLVESSESVHENSVSTALTSSDAEEKTDEGQKLINAAEESMAKMSDQIKYSMVSITSLKDNIANVDSILESIQTIAEQTNLLALNAAIESARAGENGRGFAVVADEVRQLAGRTQNATQEVVKVLSELTKGAETAVDAMAQGEELVEVGVTRVQETHSALQEITSLVTEITEKNTVIVSAANAQTSISTDNKNSIDSLSQVASQVANDAEVLTTSSSSLADMANQLEQLVSTFKFNR